MDSNNKRHVLGNHLEIEQILLEAQHRWLRPAEICEILQNYKSFRICPEPADRPPSGSLFLFDRKVLRYFRKDGHNWRKKKDGKTVKEAHERLKAGSVDVLHCYYAHGEDNENFQRRSYWMLEEALSHIVLVHYRDVKGNRTNSSHIRENVEGSHTAQEAANILSKPEMSNSGSSSMQRNPYHNHSPTSETTNLSSMHASQYEDAESAYNDESSRGTYPFLEARQPTNGNLVGASNTYYAVSNDCQDSISNFHGMNVTSLAPVGTCGDGANRICEHQKHRDYPSWEDVLKNCAEEIPSMPFDSSLLSAKSDELGTIFKQESHVLGQLMTDGHGKPGVIASDKQGQREWQTSDGFLPELSNWSLDMKHNLNTYGEDMGSLDLLGSMESCHSYPTEQRDLPSKSEPHVTKLESELYQDGRPVMKHSLLQDHVNEDGLKKLDSFNRWMSKELGDVDDFQSSSGAYWSAVGNENEIDDSGGPSQVHLEGDMVGPSLSMDQLFSIIDFSPNWAYEDSEIKVLITGKFLRGQNGVEKLKWSCMFGEVEVPAEVIADGVLRCIAPHHKHGRVPFYVTCSNRVACSEVRDFEYRAHPVQEMDDTDARKEYEDILRMRFVKLLSLGLHSLDQYSSSTGENSNLSGKINELMNDDYDEWDNMLRNTSRENFSSDKTKDLLMQKLLKEKLRVWLLHKAAEGEKGANLLDEEGQGVLHIAAALGYGWAIPPTILAGVNLNFRDVNGWTALHWAAFCGRERTVASLISLEAAAGALTDPTLKYPSGRTAADLASANGHKGIAGYLAESALSSHLSSLDLKESREGDSVDVSGVKAVQAVAERDASPIAESQISYRVSLKDSLTAVCNATQAAARIHQVYRAQSFQRKQIQEYEEEDRSSNEAALSRIALKQPNAFHGGPVAAATRIQNKFRSYKGRREFLIIRQRIVKLQAHVRGHQVRKKYGNIIWSVGILEKVILRWRRKGSGLRGFKPEGQTESPSNNTSSLKEDDYDFLKLGRKQTEERLQKALTRVKSMVQYPEARDQYRRLLNVVSEIKETKVVYDRALNSNTDDMTDFDDDLIDLDTLFDADDMDSLMTPDS